MLPEKPVVDHRHCPNCGHVAEVRLKCYLCSVSFCEHCAIAKDAEERAHRTFGFSTSVQPFAPLPDYPRSFPLRYVWACYSCVTRLVEEAGWKR